MSLSRRKTALILLYRMTVVTVNVDLQYDGQNSISSSSSRTRSNVTTSLGDAGMNDNNSNNTSVETAAGKSAEELSTGPIGAWLSGLLTSSFERLSSSSSSFVDNSILSRFIQQVGLRNGKTVWSLSSYNVNQCHSFGRFHFTKRTVCYSRCWLKSRTPDYWEASRNNNNKQQ